MCVRSLSPSLSVFLVHTHTFFSVFGAFPSPGRPKKKPPIRIDHRTDRHTQTHTHSSPLQRAMQTPSVFRAKATPGLPLPACCVLPARRLAQLLMYVHFAAQPVGNVVVHGWLCGPFVSVTTILLVGCTFLSFSLCAELDFGANVYTLLHGVLLTKFKFANATIQPYFYKLRRYEVTKHAHNIRSSRSRPTQRQTIK